MGNGTMKRRGVECRGRGRVQGKEAELKLQNQFNPTFETSVSSCEPLRFGVEGS